MKTLTLLKAPLLYIVAMLLPLGCQKEHTENPTNDNTPKKPNSATQDHPTASPTMV